MALVVISMGAMRLSDPIHLATGPMLWVATSGIATEVVALGLLYRQQSGDLNVRGAYWHILQTFVGSIIIIVSALVIRFTGFLAIDPLLGMAFGVVLLWASWGILRDATHLLMDGTPSGVNLRGIAADLSELPGVRRCPSRSRLGADQRAARLLEPCARRRRHRSPGGAGASAAVCATPTAFISRRSPVETRCLDEAAAAAIDITAARPIAGQ